MIYRKPALCCAAEPPMHKRTPHIGILGIQMPQYYIKVCVHGVTNQLATFYFKRPLFYF